MNSKSQMAVFVIAIAVIGMFLFYIVLVDPATRWEMLFGDIPPDNGTNGGSGPGSSSEFYSTNLNQYIGRTNGEQIGTTHILNNIYSTHPLVLSTIETASSTSLTSSWLFSAPHQIAVPEFINENNTESLELSFTLSSTIGNPIVKVVFNGNTLLERQMRFAQTSRLVLAIRPLVSEPA